MNIAFLNSGFFSTALYIVIAVFVLLLMVLIHELGHYTAGRLLKFKINEFSIGFGKAIFSKKNKRGEIISLRVFPLGGYCAFEGENEEGEVSKKDKVGEEGDKTNNLSNPQAFNNQKPWKRLIVLFSGAFFNFVSAIIFTFILLLSYGYDIVEVTNQPSTEYEYVLFGGNEVLQGDVVLAVNGEWINFAKDASFGQLISKCAKDSETPIILTVERNGVVQEVTIKFRNKLKESIYVFYDDVAGEYRAFDKSKVFSDAEIADKENREIYISSDSTYPDAPGITVIENEGKILFVVKDLNIYTNEQLLDTTNKDIYVYNKNSENKFVPVFKLGMSLKTHPSTFVEALLGCVPLAGKMAWVVLKSLFMLITFQIPISQIGGPVTTITAIATYTKASFSNFFVLLPLIAANLAMFNLIPFPALDGAHMLFTSVEWVRGKPINKKIESYINMAGFIFLFAFIIVVDVLHFIM